MHADKLDKGVSKTGPLQSRYENVKPSSRIAAFTAESNIQAMNLFINRPPSAQPRDNSQTASSVNKRAKESLDDTDPKNTNVYQKALRSFLGKEAGVRPPSATSHQAHMQGKAVRPKRNVLDERKEDTNIKGKKTLLFQGDKSIESGQKSIIPQASTSGNYRRPNSAPLKDKDKLNNPRKAGPPRAHEYDGYTSKYLNQGREDPFGSIKKDPVPEGTRVPSAFGRTRESPLANHHPASTNTIYKGPVIKKKVLN